MTTKSLSRRDFLRLFTHNAAQSASEVVSALVPPPSGMRREKRRTRPQLLATVSESTDPQSVCARCCAPFAAADDNPYCPECRAQEARSLSVLSSVTAERAE